MQLDVENLSVAFPTPLGYVEMVKGVSFRIGHEKVAIVGESGSGKSLSARAILKLLPKSARVVADRLTIDGVDVLTASEPTMRSLRGGSVGFVLQDPKYSLNPVITAGNQIAEAWCAHNKGARRGAYAAVLDLLSQMQIRDPARVAEMYPHELSGGMGQRVMIAMMLAPKPKLLIADEPTSALDASVQSEIINLIDDLSKKRQMGLLIITHDLPLVSRLCDRVLVMKAGRIVEEISASRLSKATHPYTRGLLECLPSFQDPVKRLKVMDRVWEG